MGSLLVPKCHPKRIPIRLVVRPFWDVTRILRKTYGTRTFREEVWFHEIANHITPRKLNTDTENGKAGVNFFNPQHVGTLQPLVIRGILYTYPRHPNTF